MQPRDLFDGLLVAIFSVILYLEVIGLTISTDSVESILTAVRSIDAAILLAIGGALGAFFLAFITLYVPQKQRTNQPEQKSR